ncbi:MAG TPA: DUF3618 domain-containing protein [Pseudolabrys sp.]
MATSEQLEREAELTRAQITDSLAELRERMTPGQMMDETMDYFRDGRAGHFVRNLGQQVVNNPIPVALIGAGIGWLMLGNRGSRSADVLRAASQMRASGDTSVAVDSAKRSADRAGKDASAWAKDSASDMGDASRDAGFRLKGAARDAGAAVSGAASSLGDTASSLYAGAEEAYDVAADRARGMGRSASTLGSNAVESSRNLMAYLRDEPLVLAGIGVALGAVLGTALQITETEKQLMGKSSDAVKEGVGEAAEQTWEKGKAVAGDAADKIWEEAKDGIKSGMQNQPQEQSPSGNGGQSPHSGAPEQTASAGNQWSESQPTLVPDPDSPSVRTADPAARKVIPGE